jgi:hypothetical protein
MKLKKGSPEAKRFMAKIRAKKKPVKKLGNVIKKVKLSKEKKYYIENDNTADVLVAIKPNIFSPNVEFAMLFTEAEANKILRNSKSYKKYNINSLSGIKESNKLKKDLKAKKLRLTHGYTTVKRKLSGVIKNRSLGASGDYAKFEIAVIKNLAKLLKKTYKKVQEIVNTDESLLNIISKNFDKNISVSVTAKELKAKLIVVAKKNPLDSFIEILNKLPKKDQVSRSVKFPIKLPATVQIGSLKNSNEMILNDLKVLEYRRKLAIGQEESFLNISTNFNTNSIQYKKNKKYAREYTNLIKYYTLQINKLKKLIK